MGGRGGEDLGELQQPQGRDPGAAPHPKLALGRHHHSHHHTITNRVREREREGGAASLQSWNAGAAVWGKVGVMGVLIVYLLHLL